MSKVFSGHLGPLCLNVVNRPTVLEELSRESQANLLATQQLVHALFNVEPVSEDQLAHLSSHIRGEIRTTLEKAAGQAPADLAEQLISRGEAVVTRDYEAAARLTLTSPGPWRLILSEPLWSWTGTRTPTLVLFREEGGWAISEGLEPRLENLAATDSISSTAWGTRPDIRIGSKLLTAGRAAVYPQEFAHFLPEDEGVNGNHLTLFYADFFLERIQRISLPNLRTLGVERPLDMGGSEQWALDWFRGHDLSHFMFDEMVFGVTGLQRLFVHALREFFADTGGLIAAESTFSEGSNSVYLAELIRYASRDDGRRSADALSSRLQLAVLMEPFDSWIEAGKALDKKEFLNPVHELRKELLELVRRGNAARIEPRLERILGSSTGLVTRLGQHDQQFLDDLFVVTGVANSPSQRTGPASAGFPRCGHAYA